MLCRKVAAKRVEDGVDNQSVCSQVLVRKISQLANAPSADSTDEEKKTMSTFYSDPETHSRQLQNRCSSAAVQEKWQSDPM